MIRKLFVLSIMAVAAFALSASSASAQGVHVENPGHHEVENELALGIYGHVGTTEFPVLSCDNDWEAEVEEDGHIVLHVNDILTHAGGVGACATAAACDQSVHPWEGQIVEDFVDQNNVSHEFGVHLTFCLDGTGSALNGLEIPVECEISDDEAHCDYRIGGAGTPTNPFIEVVGEVGFHESLGLMHAL